MLSVRTYRHTPTLLLLPTCLMIQFLHFIPTAAATTDGHMDRGPLCISYQKITTCHRASHMASSPEFSDVDIGSQERRDPVQVTMSTGR